MTPLVPCVLVVKLEMPENLHRLAEMLPRDWLHLYPAAKRPAISLQVIFWNWNDLFSMFSPSMPLLPSQPSWRACCTGCRKGGQSKVRLGGTTCSWLGWQWHCHTRSFMIGQEGDGLAGLCWYLHVTFPWGRKRRRRSSLSSPMTGTTERKAPATTVDGTALSVAWHLPPEQRMYGRGYACMVWQCVVMALRESKNENIVHDGSMLQRIMENTTLAR